MPTESNFHVDPDESHVTRHPALRATSRLGDIDTSSHLSIFVSLSLVNTHSIFE